MPARRRLNRIAGHVLAPRAVRVAERESVAPRPSRKYEHGEPMDEQGFVHVPQRPGLGMNINWDYIEKNKIE